MRTAAILLINPSLFPRETPSRVSQILDLIHLCKRKFSLGALKSSTYSFRLVIQFPLFIMLTYKKFKAPFFCLTLGCSLLSPVHSQESPASNTLQEVQVINTSPLPGIGIEKNKLPYDVQTFNSSTLRQGNSLNLSEYMTENLNGVNVNDIQGSPYQSDVTYRGLRASATLGASQGLSVYLDGVRVNEPFGDVVNWDMFPEVAFDNVTLVPGSNPIYGLNTLGGSLAFTTKSGLTTQGNELGLSLGSFGRTKIDLTHGSKSGDGWHRFIAGSAFSEQGWRDESAGSLQNLFVKVGRDGQVDREERSQCDLEGVADGHAQRGGVRIPLCLDHARRELRQCPLHDSLC